MTISLNKNRIFNKLNSGGRISVVNNFIITIAIIPVNSPLPSIPMGFIINYLVINVVNTVT